MKVEPGKTMIGHAAIFFVMASLLIFQSAGDAAAYQPGGLVPDLVAVVSQSGEDSTDHNHDCQSAVCSVPACAFGQCASSAAVPGQRLPAPRPATALVHPMNIEVPYGAHSSLPWRPPIVS